MVVKPIDKLTIDDLIQHPIWEFAVAYAGGDDLDETAVSPVLHYPVDCLENCVIGIQVRLANGENRWGLIGNVDVNNEKYTRAFMGMSIWNHDKRFHLARQMDAFLLGYQPKDLAKFLGLSIVEVFPISYDLTEHVSSDVEVLKGRIDFY
jgi:hypothetical protein